MRIGPRAGLSWRGLSLTAIALALALALAPAPAAALDENPADWEAAKACEKRLCTLILGKEPAGDDLSCALAKTWPKSTLDGGEGKLVKWGFGDARCTVDLGLERRAVIAALSQPTFSLEVPEHKVACQVESDGEMKDVRVKLAPRIDFKNGKAHKIWINLKDVKGPGSIKATVWTAANVQDTLGIFHKSMLKSVNKFMHKQCAERYGPGAATAAAKKDEKSRKASAAEAAPAPAARAETATATEKVAPAAPIGDAAAKPDAPAPASVPTSPVAAPAEKSQAAESMAKTPAPASGEPAVTILNPAAAAPPQTATAPPAASRAPPQTTPSKVAGGTAPSAAKPAAKRAAKAPAKSEADDKSGAPDPLDDDIDHTPWAVPLGKKPGH